jgi:hypothetical protein
MNKLQNWEYMSYVSKEEHSQKYSNFGKLYYNQTSTSTTVYTFASAMEVAIYKTIFMDGLLNIYIKNVQYFDYLYNYFNMENIVIHFTYTGTSIFLIKKYIINRLTIDTGYIKCYNVNTHISHFIIYWCKFMEFPLYCKKINTYNELYYIYYKSPIICKFTLSYKGKIINYNNHIMNITI